MRGALCLVLGKKILSSILALLVFMWTGSVLTEMSAEASPVPACPIIEVRDVVPGMRGTGKTVFHGTQPEDFDVEVIAVLDGAGKLSDLILIRVSGPAIEDAGGIAEGMSGSPVYVDGKLMGAIAYVFSGSDHFMGMVTPISDMLKILSYPDAVSASHAMGRRLSNQARLDEIRTAAATPVTVSGLSGRSLERLSRSLEEYGLTVRPAPTSITICARASSISISAPIAAAIGASSSTTPLAPASVATVIQALASTSDRHDETATATLGFANPLPPATRQIMRFMSSNAAS
jgi:hypothetical protein